MKTEKQTNHVLIIECATERQREQQPQLQPRASERRGIITLH